MLIPNKIRNVQSNGEIIVFNKFKYEKVPYYVLHSVFLHHHIKNISGEIDFLILIPDKGIFCLEVKHGPVSRLNGTWRYKNDFSDRGPFQQANEAMHSIRKWMLENSCKSRDLNKIIFGYGIIFSGMNSPIPLGTEGEQWQVLYRPELTEVSINNFMNRLAANWHIKYQKENWYDERKARPTQSDCEYLVKLIRGDFSRNYSALNEMLDLKNYINTFTEQQLSILDHVKYNERSVIEGYAGTGKTVLAMDLFKYYLKKGDKVGFFCYNNSLGQNLQQNIQNYFKNQELRNSYIGTFHSFLLSESNISVPNEVELNQFFQKQLPTNFLLSADREEDDKFDIIIVDEAQDLITEDNLLIFDEIIKNGFSEGRWIFVGDFYYQNIYQSSVDSLLILRDYSHFARLKPLTVNCRNTARISGQNALLTGVPYEENENFQMEGEHVDLQFLGENEIFHYLESAIEKYRRSKIPSECITILGDRKPTPSGEEKKALQKIYDQFRVKFVTIHSYKGLENDIVFLILSGKDFEKETLDLIYTGISRARVKLHLILDKSMKKQYAQHINTIYDKNKGTINNRT